MRTLAGIFAIVLVSSNARAADDVKPIYVGAQASIQDGSAIFLNRAIPAGGVDWFAGRRFNAWISLEGFLGARLMFDSIREQVIGQPCSGVDLDWWRWATLGARIWLHAVHFERIDISLGPSIGVGVVDAHSDPPMPPVFCGNVPYRTTGVAFNVGLPFAIEVRPIPNVGIRLMTGPSLDFAFTSPGFFAISMNASIGPVIRF